MSIMLRGQATGLQGVPRHWRGPLPDLSIARRLPDLDGYATVPADLLFGGFPDLGVLTWVLLRLNFDGRLDVASYDEFGTALGYGDLSANALQKRFRAAIAPLLGTWIERVRTSDNQHKYQALMPEKRSKRYAMIRRSDVELLHVVHRKTGQSQVTVADLADFGRWQLECGRRGWTADPGAAIAERWGVGEATLRKSRDRLSTAGLLEVTRRPGGRFTDLVWLKELYDPHWAVPSERADSQTPRLGAARSAGTPPFDRAPKVESRPKYPRKTAGPLREKRLVHTAKSGGSTPRETAGPYKEDLPEGLSGDLSVLGGASATPLTLVDAELAPAVPQAAPSPEPMSPAHVHTTAASLISDRRTLASAPAHYRKAMLATIRRAIESELDPRHVERALDRVLDEGEIELHCEIVRAAVKQAWADQRAGMCAECAAPPRESHEAGCRRWIRPAQEADAAQVAASAAASLNEVANRRANSLFPSSVEPGRASGAASGDVLERYLPKRSSEPSRAAHDDAVTAMTSRIAQLLMQVDDTKRLTVLATIVRQWRAQLDPSQHVALETAAAMIELALSAAARQAS